MNMILCPTDPEFSSWEQPVPAAKLLVIEDNLSDIYILRHALGELREEFDLEIVSDGDVALQFVNGQRANRHDAKPCVIVLDLHLPKHDGLEILRAIRQEPALTHVHVVVLSTAASPQEEGEIRKMGAAYRRKPTALSEYADLAADLIAICKDLQPAA
jgi:CheY-like chemotaxis protein